ncbi:MAG TPA: SDR family oxidoreductase [Gammaproteobacteria bacterium]|nr:SDR family oxidoreductase [Gammaproteobacteria bacterium]HIK70327.1 SDR family oxidoreductase [Pseudomonadales bacterium]
MSLKGKTAVVIGASGTNNFGVAIARKLAENGCTVVVSGRRIEPLRELASELGGVAVACDISDESQIKKLFETAHAETGSVDIAVNSAGGLAAAPISMLTKELIQPTLDVSFTGALLFMRYAAEHMDTGGSVMTISSLTARLPGPALAVYAAARSGIDFAIRVAAVEYGAQKIRFNSIAAGLIHTDMTDAMFQDDATNKRFIPHIPLARMGNPNDIAETALWLADDEKSPFITGQLIDVSGGQHMGRLPQ